MYLNNNAISKRTMIHQKLIHQKMIHQKKPQHLIEALPRLDQMIYLQKNLGVRASEGSITWKRY